MTGALTATRERSLIAKRRQSLILGGRVVPPFRVPADVFVDGPWRLVRVWSERADYELRRDDCGHPSGYTVAGWLKRDDDGWWVVTLDILGDHYRIRLGRDAEAALHALWVARGAA